MDEDDLETAVLCRVIQPAEAVSLMKEAKKFNRYEFLNIVEVVNEKIITAANEGKDNTSHEMKRCYADKIKEFMKNSSFHKYSTFIDPTYPTSNNELDNCTISFYWK